MITFMEFCDLLLENDGDNLLLSILNHPLDESAWLVYSDWLEENDATAEQIRQVRLAVEPRFTLSMFAHGNDYSFIELPSFKRRLGWILNFIRYCHWNTFIPHRSQLETELTQELRDRLFNCTPTLSVMHALNRRNTIRYEITESAKPLFHLHFLHDILVKFINHHNLVH